MKWYPTLFALTLCLLHLLAVGQGVDTMGRKDTTYLKISRDGVYINGKPYPVPAPVSWKDTLHTRIQSGISISILSQYAHLDFTDLNRVLSSQHPYHPPLTPDYSLGGTFNYCVHHWDFGALCQTYFRTHCDYNLLLGGTKYAVHNKDGAGCWEGIVGYNFRWYKNKNIVVNWLDSITQDSVYSLFGFWGIRPGLGIGVGHIFSTTAVGQEVTNFSNVVNDPGTYQKIMNRTLLLNPKVDFYKGIDGGGMFTLTFGYLYTPFNNYTINKVHTASNPLSGLNGLYIGISWGGNNYDVVKSR